MVFQSKGRAEVISLPVIKLAPYLGTAAAVGFTPQELTQMLGQS